MKVDSQNIIGELERLAEAMPWDAVDIWITREPKGVYRFTAYVRENRDMGLSCDFGNGATPKEAVDDVIKSCKNRDPEIARKAKIAELQEQIRKLEQVVIGLPPYRPNRELVDGQPVIKAPDTIDV